jgi:hypothetical protein
MVSADNELWQISNVDFIIFSRERIELELAPTNSNYRAFGF